MCVKNVFDTRYDAVIVGARCAGASTAMLLARSGLKVLLIDRQKYGSDTVSTHALMRAGVLQLMRWGLLPKLIAAATPPVTRTSFHYGEERVSLDIKPDHGVTYLCAPRRHVLDRILVDAAREAGADVRHGVSLTDVRFDSNDRVDGVYLTDGFGNEAAVCCDLLVGADGRQSRVARQIKARTIALGRYASGYAYGYFDGLPDEGFHWYFNHGAAAGIIPTNGQSHCVFVGVPQGNFARTFRGNLPGGFKQVAAAASAHLSDGLEHAASVTSLRGFSGGAGFMRQAHGPGWALVGDAGYFKDPLTAHGITDAFRDAELLSRAVLAGKDKAFAEFQSERDALSRPLFDATDKIASFDWSVAELQGYHERLSAAMKAETHRVAQFAPCNELAA